MTVIKGKLNKVTDKSPYILYKDELLCSRNAVCVISWSLFGLGKKFRVLKRSRKI